MVTGTRDDMDKEDVVHTPNGILLSHKKNEIMPFTETWMHLELIILSEVRQWKTNIIWYHLYVKSKKKGCKWTYLQNKSRLIDFENKHGYRRGQMLWGGMDWGSGSDRCTLWYTESLATGDLLYSTGKFTQYLVMVYVGKGSEKELMCVHV